jgi:PKD repeat protein
MRPSIFYLLALLLQICTNASATELRIAVTYIDSTLGVPQTNKQVYINIPKPAYSKLLYTDALGIARDTVIMPDTAGVLEVTVVDCDGQPRIKYAAFGHGIQSIKIGFNYCDQTYIPCKADFYFYKGTQPLYVQFDSRSSGARFVKHHWNFGDGDSSISATPLHTFPFNGTFTVKLTVTDALGRKDSVSKSVIVGTTGIGCNSYYTSSRDSIDPLKIHLQSAAAGSNLVYFWTFGDGYSASDTAVTHQYKRAGKYNVCLHVAEKNASCLALYCDSITAADTSKKAGLKGTILNFSDLSVPPFLMVFSQDSAMALVDSFALVSSGEFDLIGLSKGAYYLRADPKENDSAKFLCTYYGQTALWQESVVCLISGSASSIEWNVLPRSFIKGTSLIELQVQGLTKQQIHNSRAVLRNANKFLGDYSPDNEGRYVLPDLINDSLVIYIDLPGFICRPLRIDLRKAPPPGYPLKFTAIGNTIQPVLVSGYAERRQTGLLTFPNPTLNKLHITPVQHPLEISMYDVNGRNIPLTLDIYTNQTAIFDVSTLTNGIYFIRYLEEVISFIKK